jgi:acetyl-CoA carboxylase biotin carboxyl carrier protein
MTTEREEIARSLFNPKVLRQLLWRLESTDVSELDIVSGDSRLYVRRAIDRRSAGGARSSEHPPDRQDIPVSAPLTGVYYSRAEPTGEPFVSPGDPVEAGQVVALIESMKLFNEVSAEVSGEVVSVEVNDGDLVETGQAIMYIEPREGGEQGPPHGLL